MRTLIPACLAEIFSILPMIAELVKFNKGETLGGPRVIPVSSKMADRKRLAAGSPQDSPVTNTGGGDPSVWTLESLRWRAV